MSDNALIAKTIAFVKETLKEAEAGHDWFHVQRVYRNAKKIAEGENVNHLVVALGALLHDIADAKFHDGDETVGPKVAKAFLERQDADAKVVAQVTQIIAQISYKNSLENKAGTFSKSLELQVVQDADRLDAIGAIGIARTFHYGGFKNRQIYNPEIPPNQNLTKEEYKQSTAPTINHFYEKLLLLKDQMNTENGKRLANQRHEFMQRFLEQFYSEWNP